MKSVLICNQKGGVGKSLIADELAFAMDRCGTPYSFCDLDDQGGTIHKTRDTPGAEVQIIDTPGALQKDIIRWMDAADIVVIPFRPTSRDIPPLLRIMTIADQHAKDKPVLYVMNAWNRYKASRDFREWLNAEQQNCGNRMQIVVVPQSEMFVQASAMEISVVERDPRCSAAAAIKQMSNWVRLMLGMTQEPVIPI